MPSEFGMEAAVEQKRSLTAGGAIGGAASMTASEANTSALLQATKRLEAQTQTVWASAERLTQAANLLIGPPPPRDAGNGEPRPAPSGHLGRLHVALEENQVANIALASAIDRLLSGLS